MTSPFLWKGKPSETGEKRKPARTTDNPIPLTFSKRVQSSSSASAQPLKQKPGVGRSASA